MGTYFEDGRFTNVERDSNDLVLEVPDTKSEFKPFDKVLVKNEGGLWNVNLFGYYTDLHNYPYATLDRCWQQCIPYEGNEHLLGTTNEPNKK